MKNQEFIFKDDGFFPNSVHPVILHRDAILFHELAEEEARLKLQERVQELGWEVEWLWKIFRRPHYHSTTHEALVVFQGRAHVHIGGHRVGISKIVQAGDSLVIPAGVVHQAILRSDDFLVFGCYPRGAKKWDILGGRKRERRSALANIKNLDVPPAFI